MSQQQTMIFFLDFSTVSSFLKMAMSTCKNKYLYIPPPILFIPPKPGPSIPIPQIKYTVCTFSKSYFVTNE